MKKTMKYILVSSVLIISSFGTNGSKVHAGIRNRIGSFFRNLNCFSSSNSKTLNNNLKIKVSNKVLSKANDLSSKGITLGVDIDNFDETAVNNLSNKKWYLQRKTSSGNIITMVANTEPKVIDVNGENVTVKFKDSTNNKIIAHHKGLPNWLSGKSINKKHKEGKFTALNNTTTVEERESTQGNRLELRRSSIEQGNILGTDINRFDFSDLEDLNDKNWYNQFKFGRDNIVTVETGKEPSVVYGPGKYIIKNKEGKIEEKFKFINWIKGKDLKDYKEKNHIYNIINNYL